MSGQNGSDGQMVTVEEILERVDAAVDGMGERNPNRLLLLQCRAAIAYLASRMPDESVITRGGIILP